MVSPLHSHFLSNSSLRPRPPLVKGRKVSFYSTHLSLLSIISDEDRIFLKASTFPSAAPQTIENDQSPIQDLKISIGSSSNKSLCGMIVRPVEEERSTSPKSSQACSTSHFSLLMDNLDALEETFVDSDVLRLDRDILILLRRLGAMKLFSTYLSRIHDPYFFYLSDVSDEDIGQHMINRSACHQVVVCSKKKTERKLRRKRALANANRSCSFLLSSKTKGKNLLQPTVSTVKTISNSRSRRLVITRNEAEMSRGIKIVANLERIRTTLEEESGKVPNLSCWAEAAGVNDKLLLQYLHFGWYCRVELLRSTRSLVLYLARNYKGLGIAYEDLLQAGSLGVLQGAERFDHTRGYQFSTYVQYWIRKSMSTMVTGHARGIRIPGRVSREIHQIKKARKALNNNPRKYPGDDEIAKFTGLSLNKIRSASKCLRVVGSIDQKIGDRAKYLEFMPDMTVMSPEETVMRQHMKKDIHDLLEGLDSREKQVMVRRYGLNGYRPMSLEEIGKLFGVSKEWIRKIEKKAMTKLRGQETCKSLTYYLKL